MKFSFSPSSTDLEKVEEGTQLLLGDIKSEKELEIQVEFQENVPLTIARNGDHLHITCQEPAHYYRGLNWAVHHLEDTWNTKSEPVYFSKNGVMLDCSRNAVFTVEKVKSFIRIMAKLGMNTLMLYTENFWHRTCTVYPDTGAPAQCPEMATRRYRQRHRRHPSGRKRRSLHPH